MWILYLSIVPVFLLFNNHRIRNYRMAKNELLKRNEAENNAGLSPKETVDYIRVDYNG